MRKFIVEFEKAIFTDRKHIMKELREFSSLSEAEEFVRFLKFYGMVDVGVSFKAIRIVERVE